LLLTNPRISTLAAMTKVFAPLDTKQNHELLKLLSTIKEFDALPQWVQDHLLKVEQLFEQDESSLQKHLAGQHDQSSHANRLSAQSPDFSDSEKQAIANYSGTATLQVNHKLRGLPTKGILPSVFDLRENEIENIVTNLDSAIDKSSLKATMKLQREIPTSSIPSGLFSSAVGKTIKDKGFLSLRNTQDNIPARNGFVKMIVTAPAGTKALDLSFINPNAMGEVIFPRGTKIKITSVKGQRSDTIVRGEIVE